MVIPLRKPSQNSVQINKYALKENKQMNTKKFNIFIW